MSKEKETVDLPGMEAPATTRREIPADLLTPRGAAQANADISAVVKEVMAAIAPLLAANQAAAFTPEKLTQVLVESDRIRRLPSEDEQKKIARAKREKKLMQQEINESISNTQAIQNSCSHKYVNGVISVSAIRNYPDHQPRYICHSCMLLMQPRRWEILAPTEEFPRGVEKIVDAHPLYAQIHREYSILHPQF